MVKLSAKTATALLAIHGVRLYHKPTMLNSLPLRSTLQPLLIQDAGQPDGIDRAQSIAGTEETRSHDALYEVSRVQLHEAWLAARRLLIAEQTPERHWVGQLSTSALSTATAISALALIRQADTLSYRARREEIDATVTVAANWLIDQQNADGGFGDTDLSHSNIATTLLVLAAWQLANFSQPASDNIARAWQYCESVGKWDALRRRYGKDKTFVAPILTNCALAGIVSWDTVPTLPFEAAWLPQSWYRLARMPVVSYAVPALVAIGQAKFYHRPVRGPLGALRRRAIGPTLDVLQRMQPSSGGYLEAVPLTSFVLMCLADMRLGDHPVARRAIDFLLASRLVDGSLPIDTNLATWTTSLSIAALDYGQRSVGPVIKSQDLDQHQSFREQHVEDPSTQHTEDPPAVTASTIRWLLSCQHWSEHPFTGARPGGWGWSNLSGAVPDADDTPAALLALASWWSSRHRMRGDHVSDGALQKPGTVILDAQIEHAAGQGLKWLLSLQNRDGGWPTFCRGWGKLPFDRSGSDLTAHALRALHAWQQLAGHVDGALTGRVARKIPVAMERGFAFLAKRQNSDGSWFPLWFGNQDQAGEENPVYGTAKVLLAFAQCGRMAEPTGQHTHPSAAFPAERGLQWLIKNQNADGGWGGGPSVPYRVVKGLESTSGSSVEETGWALEALLAAGGSTASVKPTIMRGLNWMVAAVQQDRLRTSWPIGFYFAKLWYHERLYPLIAATVALGSAVEWDRLRAGSP